MKNSNHTKKIQLLRDELKRQGLNGLIVPLHDEYQGEWIPAHSRRLEWLTGFTGSAGVAILLDNRAAIFVDGRYTLQAQQQVNISVFELHHIAKSSPKKWLAEMPAKTQLGYDPWLHSPKEVDMLTQACNRANSALIALENNPIDTIWIDQPAAPSNPIVAYSHERAGETSQHKRARIGKLVSKTGATAVLLTAPDSIAWLLNIRGSDLEYTPVPLAFAILLDNGEVQLFVCPSRISSKVKAHLDIGVTVEHPNRLGTTLDKMGSRKQKVLLDIGTTVSWLHSRLQRAGADIIVGKDPCQLPKACKNTVELAGIREAHKRDGAALSRLLHWLEEEGLTNNLTEMTVCRKLECFRSQHDYYRGPSFPTIAAAGPNGAIVHYRPTQETDRRLELGELFLLDSGAQYIDGTTDVTRTIVLGTPDKEQRDRFTRVLKGHIALAQTTFVEGTNGSQLDVLARLPLWNAGLDFDHGTGHGVGAFLNVHEGPQRISKVANSIELRPGMVLSNEPGYYKENSYGIRIENLVSVEKLSDVVGAERERLGFETLTLAPIDCSLIEIGLLDKKEIEWLNAYHLRVMSLVGPIVDSKTRAWLKKTTEPIGANTQNQ